MSPSQETNFDINQRIGRNLRTLRHIAGLTQTELAQRLGLTFQQIQKYERAANRIPAPVIYQVTQILNCRLEDLFAGLPENRTGGGIRSLLDDVNGWMQKSRIMARLLRILIHIPSDRQAEFLRVMEKLAQGYGGYGQQS